MDIPLIGNSINRIDGYGKVTGKSLYPGDYNFPNQLFMKVLFSSRPHAIIKKVDTSTAEKNNGVIAIYTAKDVPVNEYGLIMNDQPVLCGPGSSKPFADRVRFIGDQIALIIAETEDIAESARNQIRVEYEDLPIITDPHAAMMANAFQLHPDRESNVFCNYKIRKGDIEKGFTNSDVIIESDYYTPAQEHAYLQPEAGVSYVDDEDRIVLVVSGQWIHEDQEQIAHALGLPKEKIRVIYPAIGGAFGGREDMSVQIILGLATFRLHQAGINRPVKIVWTREESIIGHHKRHPYHIHAKWGANKDGKILAAAVKIIADGGAYAYTSTKVMGNATLLVTGPYEIPNVHVDAFAVYTNNLPNGAFRGFGGPQACFEAEMQVNKLAEALQLDPVEFRMLNLIKEGIPTSVGSALPKGISIRKVLEECALHSGWSKTTDGWKLQKRNVNDSNLLTGKGISIGYKNVGFSFGAPEECWATIEIHGKETIEHVIVHHAGADVGQGAHSLIAQITADALKIPLEKIELVVSDTASSDNSGSASASRMTFMAGNSILGAAKMALEKWNNEERPAIANYQYKPLRTTPFNPENGECTPNFAYGYAATAVDLEINQSTGKVEINNVICVDDVGKAINPIQVKGQIEGAIIQALGYALLENFKQKDGFVYTKGFSTYLIPTIGDIPEKINPIILEITDPIGPLGARGMGEMPFLPFAPAVADGIHDATGKWFDSFPFLEETVLKGLGEL